MHAKEHAASSSANELRNALKEVRVRVRVRVRVGVGVRLRLRLRANLQG